MITQGICEDGAAILDDGKKLTVDEIVSRLNGAKEDAEFIKEIRENTTCHQTKFAIDQWLEP